MTQEFDHNGSSAPTDGAASEANVSLMAPFRKALKEIDKDTDEAMTMAFKALGNDMKDMHAAYAHIIFGLLRSRSILLKALEEATSMHKAGSRSSTPSG